MKINSCHPNYGSISIDEIEYKDAKYLKILLESDRPCGGGACRWDGLIAALELIIASNRPAETAV